MNLAQVVAAYVTHRQAMGMHFRTEARIVQSFSRALGELRTIKEIPVDQLLAFLAGTGPVTRNWERKHSALGGLYRFAVTRAYVERSPLPRTVLRPQKALVPYIYSREELRRLLDAVAANDHPGCHIDPGTSIGRSCSCFMARGRSACTHYGRCRPRHRGRLHPRQQVLQEQVGADRRSPATDFSPLRRKAPTAACRGRIALLCLPQGHCGDPAGRREGLLPPAGPCQRRMRSRRCPTSAALA